MQITRRKDTMIALAALGASFGAGALTVTTASADTAGFDLAKNVTAGSFDLTKQVSGTMIFPVMFDRPSGVNAAALAGAVKGLGSDSSLYKSAVKAVPELAGDTNSLLSNALDSGSSNYNSARATIVKLINWYNSLGGQRITTQGGAAYTTSNLDQPINVLAVGFSNNNSVNQAATSALANINAAKNTGDVMRALDSVQSGLSVPFSTAFSNYASKVYASGANMNDLTQISAVQPVLNAYEGMYANGASAIRKSLLSGQASSTEAGVAFFESAVLAGNTSNSGSDSNHSNTPTTKTQYSTRWVDESGNELTASETSETGYGSSKTFNGYTLVSEDVNEDTHTKTYHYQKKHEEPAKQVVTHWVDENGNKLKADENGQHPDNDGKSDIPGWDLVRTTTDKDGNVTNVYRKHEEPVKKVVTHWVDESGNKLKNDEDGQHPDNDGKSDIDGWDLVRTTTDKDGNVTNVYRKHEEPVKKVVTHWVDEEGNKLKDDEDGAFPDNDGKSDIDGWDLVRTTTDTDGNVTNVYKKHEEPTEVLHTYWVSTTGDTLKAPEEGSHPDNDGKSDIDGWDLTAVYTVTAEDLAKGGSLEGTDYKVGDIINIYKKAETPAKKVVTHWVDLDGNKLKDDEDGSFPDNDGKSDIDGYTLVSVKTDPDGNVTNTYKKNETPAKTVVTHWVDEDGNKLKDDADGAFPDNDGKSDIEGYTLVSVKTDADGNVTNTYKKKTHTSWIDTEGKKLKNDEDGNHPDNDGVSDIDGYELVSTTTDEDGNTINTYKKKVVTHWVDVDGKKLKDDADGAFPDNDGKSDIDGYELVKTVVDADGNVTNIYKKIETPVKKTHTSWVDENGKKLKDDEDGNHPDNDGVSDIEGYELVSTTTDKDGNTINTYKKKEAPKPAPVVEKTPTPAPTPAPAPAPTPAPAATKLPQTGEAGNTELGIIGASLMGMATAISAVAVKGKKRKEE